MEAFHGIKVKFLKTRLDMFCLLHDNNLMRKSIAILSLFSGLMWFSSTASEANSSYKLEAGLAIKLSDRELADYLKELETALVAMEANQANVSRPTQAKVFFSVFEEVHADETCNPKRTLGWDTCVYAGYLSTFVTNTSTAEKCRFICTAPKGAPTCKNRDDVACNPLIFAKFDGGLLCVGKTGDLTARCSDASRPEMVLANLREKLNSEPGKAEWDRFQKQVADHCDHHPNWNERKKDGQGSCDLIQTAVKNAKAQLEKDEASKLAKRSIPESTVCLMELPTNPTKVIKVTNAIKEGIPTYKVYEYDKNIGWRSSRNFERVSWKTEGDSLLLSLRGDFVPSFTAMNWTLEDKKFNIVSSKTSPTICKKKDRNGNELGSNFEELKGLPDEQLRMFASQMDTALQQKGMKDGELKFYRAVLVAQAKNNCPNFKMVRLEQPDNDEYYRYRVTSGNSSEEVKFNFTPKRGEISTKALAELKAPDVLSNFLINQTGKRADLFFNERCPRRSGAARRSDGDS